MSAVTRRLSGRTLLGPPMPTTGRAVTTLADLAPGASARIVGYAADAPPSTSRRLFDLGFAPGAVIDVVRRAPAQDPVVYRVAECELAIRTVLARTLLVEGP